jgi:hypothetical protein
VNDHGALCYKGLGFRIQGLELEVEGMGFDSEFGVQGLGSEVFLWATTRSPLFCRV